MLGFLTKKTSFFYRALKLYACRWKPRSSLARNRRPYFRRVDQKTVDMEGVEIVLKAKGRHDPCILPRAPPIVESMAAIVIMDLFLIQQNT